MKTAEKIVGIDRAVALADEARKAGQRIVTTNGVFDLFSLPHLILLEAAKARGDLLFVGINSDASVHALKGPNRPIVPEGERARIVAGLACVDTVFLFDDADPRPWLQKIRPHVHVNSAEYGKTCVEAAVLKEIGAELVLLPRSTSFRSTSDIIDLIRHQSS